MRLFDRTSRRVRLTADGMRMLDEARSVLAAADNATAVAAGLSGRPADVIRVGTAPGLDRRLRHALDTLRRDEPGLTIEIDYRPTADQLEALRRGTLDLCLVRGVPSSPGLDTIELWRTPIHVALPAGHPAAARTASGSSSWRACPPGCRSTAATHSCSTSCSAPAAPPGSSHCPAGRPARWSTP